MTRDDTGLARAIGRQHMIPAAAAAARAVFAACGAAPGWKSWATRHGAHMRVTMEAFARVLDHDPGTPAQALFHEACRFGWHAGADLAAIRDGRVDTGAMWIALPPAVRAAHQTFRRVYLEMWALVDEAERAQARRVVDEEALPDPDVLDLTPGPARPADGGCEIVLMSRDPANRRPRSEGARTAARVHDAREALKRADKKRSGR